MLLPPKQCMCIVIIPRLVTKFPQLSIEYSIASFLCIATYAVWYPFGGNYNFCKPEVPSLKDLTRFIYVGFCNTVNQNKFCMESDPNLARSNLNTDSALNPTSAAPPGC